MANIPSVDVAILGDHKAGKTSLACRMAECCANKEPIALDSLFDPADTHTCNYIEFATYDDTMELCIWQEGPDFKKDNWVMFRNAVDAAVICIDCQDVDPKGQYLSRLALIREWLPCKTKIYTLVTKIDKIDQEKAQEIVDTIPVVNDGLILGVTMTNGEDVKEVLKAIAEDFVPKEVPNTTSWCNLL